MKLTDDQIQNLGDRLIATADRLNSGDGLIVRAHTDPDGRNFQTFFTHSEFREIGRLLLALPYLRETP